MSKSTTMALAVGAGYMLGRKHKLGMATVLAAGAATAGASGIAGKALGTGGKLLMSSQVLDKLPPEATKIIDLVRSDLAQAGKAAAQAAISSRIEGLTSALNDRAESVRGGGQEDADDDGQDDGTEAEGQEEEEDQGDGEERPRPRARQRPPKERSTGRSSERPAARRRSAGSTQAKPAARRRSAGSAQAKPAARRRSADGQAKPAARRRSAGNGQAKRTGSASARRTGR